MTVTVDDLVIDGVFSLPIEKGGPLPAMYPFDRRQLKANIVADKEIRDPLGYWYENGNGKPILIDGHNRYDIYEEIKGTIDPPVCVEITGPTNREEVLKWIVANDAGRRGNIEKKMEAAIREVAPAVQEEAAKRRSEWVAASNRDRHDPNKDKTILIENANAKKFNIRSEVRTQVDAMLGVPVPFAIVQRVLNVMKEEQRGESQQSRREEKHKKVAQNEAEEITSMFDGWLQMLCTGPLYSTSQLNEKVGRAYLARLLWCCEVSPKVKVLRLPNGRDKGYTFVRVGLECVERLRGNLNGLPEDVAADVTELIELFCNQEECDNG